ncbi:MAG: PilZ domain-containing protein [Thermodesulfovibrionales bacterium]
MEYSPNRRHKRHEVQDVFGSLLFTIDVTVMNMSIDGMAIESSKRLNVGRKYILKIGHSDKVLRLNGKVVWCNLIKAMKTDQGAVVPVYKAGIEFDGVISDKAKDLRNFLEDNVIIKLENRLFGRFKVRLKQSINLDSEYDFHVQTMSQSGMLIETELLPDKESVFDMELKFNGNTISIKGRVVYVKQISEPGGKQEKSHLGIEFVEFDEEAKKVLEDFIVNELEDN